MLKAEFISTIQRLRVSEYEIDLYFQKVLCIGMRSDKFFFSLCLYFMELLLRMNENIFLSVEMNKNIFLPVVGLNHGFLTLQAFQSNQ